MCNLYIASPRSVIADKFDAQFAPHLDEPEPYVPQITPFGVGPFICQDRQVKIGQWGMIPANSRTRIPLIQRGISKRTGKPKFERMMTNNARRERLRTAPTFKDAWLKGRRCLIPADSFDEPFYSEPGALNTWWRFHRADGDPWALAGIWSEWTDPATGEVVPNYSMITQNCDGHELLSLMHKYDRDLPPDKQDKRAVVPIEREDWDTWLHGTVQQAEALIRLTPVDRFRHGAADPDKHLDLGL